MAQEQMQGQPQQQGGGEMEQIVEMVMGAASGIKQLSEALGQSGQKGAADKGMQAVALIEQMMAELGAGGAPEKEAMGMQNPDVAGTNAQPVTMRG